MPRDLQTDIETLNKILSFAQQRDFERAAALAETTLASGFEHPLLFNVLASRLEQQGNYAEALKLLERAVAMAPADVNARNALALCLQRLERPAEALYHIDQMLKKNPDLPFAHAGRGNALLALGSLTQARQSHLRALELQPDNLASLGALAAIATHRGEHEEARGWAARTLASYPGYPEALLSLASAEIAAGAPERAEGPLQSLIMDSRAGSSDRARATSLLGDVLDAKGRYPEAFDAYRTCNEALRRESRAARTDMVAFARTLAAALDKVAASWPKAAAHPSPAHAFVVGFPHTGSAGMERAFDAQAQLVWIQEQELLADAVMHFMREPLNLDALVRASESDLEALRNAYFANVRSGGVDHVGRLLVDAHPLNIFKLPLIARLFPHAKLLFVWRDPRDTVLSCFRHRFSGQSSEELLTLPGLAAYFDAVMGIADTMRRVAELSWHIVRHEDWVTDPRGQAQSLFEYLQDGVRQDEHRRQAPPPEKAHWRHYEFALLPVQATLAPWVARMGYAP